MKGVYARMAKRATAGSAVVAILATLAYANPFVANGSSANDNANGSSAHDTLAVAMTVADAQTGEYAPEIHVKKSFAVVSVKAVITNVGGDTVQIAGFSTPPRCLSVVSGTTIVDNARHENGKLATTENLFSPQGLNLGWYAPGEYAIITFRLNIDDSMLIDGLNSIPIYVSARAAGTAPGENLEWTSNFATDSATLNVKKHKDSLFSWEDFPKLAAAASVGALVGAAFTALSDGLYGERLRLLSKEKSQSREAKRPRIKRGRDG